MHQKVLSMILVLVMLLGLLSVSAFTTANTTSSDSADTSYKYNIMFLDCGRKYYSVDSIEKIINNASDAGFNYIQLAVGNDGLRFLLDNMSLTVNGKTYTSKQVSDAIHAGNEKYDNEKNYNVAVDELTQSEMDEIIAYAGSKGMGVIPCVNTPGHMDAILSAATSLTGTNCSYRDSVRTIDVTNTTAVAFTKALLQKYITYFADKGCKLFNMGADEYANDKFTGGSMGFGNLQSTNKYNYYVKYVNDVAKMIENADMRPMAFNDGIYYNNNKSSGTFDTNILICYWSSGWNNVYTPRSASDLVSDGFQLINTHGDYYWVLGKTDAQCDANKARGFDKTSFPGGTISNPAGSMFCIWADYPGAETEASVISKTADTIAAFGAALPKVTSGAVTPTPTTPTPDTNTNTQTITVAVGGTKEVTVDGDYRGTYTTEDPATATVSVTGTDAVEGTEKEVTAIESEKQYLIVHKRSGLVLNDSANENGILLGDKNSNTDQLWTIKKSESGTNEYTLLGADGKYITEIASGTATLGTSGANVLMKYSSSGYWDIYQEKKTTTWYGGTTTTSYYLNQYGGTSSTKAAGYSENGASDDGSQWKILEVTPGTKATTTITFNGIAKGTTTVTIGNVKYTIKVVEQALADVTPLTIEYWITNSKMPDANRNTTVSISAASDGVASESGVSVADIVSPTGNKDSRQQEYWQSKLLNKNKVNDSTSGTEEQTTEKGDDETLSGSAFTKVRYWGGAWQVYTTDWVTVKNTDQLVAYYMEIVKITNKNGAENLHVNAADWGTKGDGTGDWGYTPESNRCSVSVQLVYEDGSTSPSATTADNLKSKTIVYGYWGGGRGLGTMVFNGKDNYQIFKVTAETGDMSSSTSGNTVTVDSFTWDNNEETVWEGAATDSVSIGNPARKPSYDAPYDNLAWNTSEHNKNNAILIRVYVKSIPKAGALTVNYFVQGNADPFYHYGINVVENTKFDPRFKRVEDADAPGKAKLVYNSVTNYDGEQQEVQSDLSKMTEIGAQYRYSNYTFTNAERSTDGKTVNLYYTFNWNKAFVVDFGLPVVIRPNDVNENLKNATLTAAEITQSTTYANISVDNDKNITYTLKQTIDGEDNFSVRYMGNITTDTGTQTGHVDYSIKVIPATSVYYEDSFATFTNGTGKAADAKWSIVGNDGNVTADKSTSQKQALTELSKMSADDVYGHDAAYADSTKLSMGSAHKVTVNANMVKGWSDGSAWPTATFTFKGTGFDIISLTDNTSGAIFVDVYAGKEATGTPVKQLTVNNYYGYEQDGNGKWVVDADSSNALYQIPVMKVSGLDYGEYTAVIRVAYSKFFDTANKNQYSFWLDAIRVYDPMGKDKEAYTRDNEGYPQYIKLRDQLAKENGPVTTNNNLLFIDGADKAAIATYANYGPNNEVYLAKDQAIAFNVPEGTSIASIQIGAKAPNGSAAQMVVNNGEPKDIQSATEMYYKIGTKGGRFTITNTGAGILSLTNLKITYTASGKSVSLAPLTTADQANAVAQVRALFAAPAEPFQPDRFEASWGHAVRKGDTATLTVKASEDVDSITVDGQTITAYTPKTERTGWGWWAKTVTYREFTYQVAAEETTDYTICAVNSAGVSSDPITATLTVRPSVRDWWHGIFDKWF